MPDFNKGDFTQQGIAGDVTSLVRLNEKRTVKLALSADDASDNCDISGSVIDELNGKTYPIGAGVSGNIEITENGENINVAPYATATVNVSGGGDIPAFEATITNETGYTMAWGLTPSGESPLLEGYGVVFGGQIPNQETKTGKYLYLYSSEEEVYYVFLAFTNLSQGDATIYADDLVNCTFEEGGFTITDPSLPSSATLTLRILQ